MLDRLDIPYWAWANASNKDSLLLVTGHCWKKHLYIRALAQALFCDTAACHHSPPFSRHTNTMNLAAPPQHATPHDMA